MFLCLCGLFVVVGLFVFCWCLILLFLFLFCFVLFLFCYVVLTYIYSLSDLVFIYKSIFRRQAMVSQIDSNGIRFIKDDLYCTGEEDDISLCTFQRKISSSCSNRAVWLNCSKIMVKPKMLACVCLFVCVCFFVVFFFYFFSLLFLLFLFLIDIMS